MFLVKRLCCFQCAHRAHTKTIGSSAAGESPVIQTFPAGSALGVRSKPYPCPRPRSWTRFCGHSRTWPLGQEEQRPQPRTGAGRGAGKAQHICSSASADVVLIIPDPAFQLPGTASWSGGASTYTSLGESETKQQTIHSSHFQPRQLPTTPPPHPMPLATCLSDPNAHHCPGGHLPKCLSGKGKKPRASSCGSQRLPLTRALPQKHL